MEVHLTPEQETQLAAIAFHHGEKPERIAQQAIAHVLAEEVRFRTAVQVGLDQANRGEWIDEADMDAYVAGLLKE